MAENFSNVPNLLESFVLHIRKLSVGCPRYATEGGHRFITMAYEELLPKERIIFGS
jgi:hypothetical protein